LEEEEEVVGKGRCRKGRRRTREEGAGIPLLNSYVK